MTTPDPQPTEPGHDTPPVQEPDDGTTEAEEDEGGETPQPEALSV